MKHLIKPTWRWAKLFTMILVIIPVLIFFGFVGAVSLIDFNQYKPKLEQEVSEQTGHQFEVSGEIEVSVFPFSFSAGDVSLKNSPSVVERFQRDTLLSVKQVRAELSIWSLLVHKQLTIKTLELIEPNLVLLRDDQGNNWHRLERFTDLGKPLVEEWKRRSAAASAQDLESFKQGFKFAGHSGLDVSGSDAQKESNQAASAQTAEWHFDSLIIKQGAFEHQDRRAQRAGKVSDLNLLALDVTLGKPFQFRSDFQYENGQNSHRYQLDVSAHLDVSKDLFRLQVTDWQGIFNLLLPEDKKVPAMRLVTEGELFALDFNQEQVEIEGVKMSSLGSKLTGSFKGKYGVNTEFLGSLDVIDVDLRKWFYHLDLPLPGFVDDDALSVLNGSFNWQMTDDRWAFNQLDLKIDETTVTGDVWQEGRRASNQNQAHTKQSRAKYLFDINVDKIDLNRYQAKLDDGFFPLLQAFREGDRDVTNDADVYTKSVKEMAAEVNKTSRPAHNATQAVYLPVAIPVSTLRTLNAHGQIKVGSITLNAVTMERVEIDLSAKQGEIQLAPFDAQLFNGTLASKLNLNVNGETPAYRWYGQLDQVALGDFLDAGWQIKPVDGTLSAHFKFNTRGSNLQILTQNLQGELNASSPSGHFYGVSLEKLLRGQNVTQNDKTNYQNLMLTGSINQGIYKAKQFSVVSTGLAGSGFGSLDFNKAALVSQLKLRVETPPSGLKNLKGVVVPVSFRGPISQLEWSVDMQSLLKDPGNQQRAVNQLKALIGGA